MPQPCVTSGADEVVIPEYGKLAGQLIQRTTRPSDARGVCSRLVPWKSGPASHLQASKRMVFANQVTATEISNERP